MRLRFISRPWLLPVLVGLVAFVARWISVESVGGLGALLGYDEGVYMGAATALVHGLIPYRDFTLVHPPGSTVLLAPFALLGRATSEPTGWAAARVFIMLLGALNAAMITLIARRISVVAAAVAGLLYAVWTPVIHVERTTMLEAFVLSAMIVALLVIRRPRETIWRTALAGAALGLGTSVKLWGAAPLAVILVWLLINRAWRQGAALTAGAAIAFAVVIAPFLAITGQRMIQLAVFAQLGRGDGGTPITDRPARMLAMDGAGAVPAHLVWSIAAALIVAAALVALLRPQARLWVALLGTQSAILLAVPVYFTGYSSFIGPALVLVIGTAVDLAVYSAIAVPLRAVFATGAVFIVIALGVSSISRIAGDGDSIRGTEREISALVDGAHCVSSDSTGVLLIYNSLGRSIDNSCIKPLIDVDGTIYAVAQENPGHLSSTARRRASPAYQELLRQYLSGGDVVLMHRESADVLTKESLASLTAKGLETKGSGLHVFGSGSPVNGSG